MEEKQEMKFPMPGADVCPNCGSDKRIGQEIINDLKKKGKLRQEIFNNGLALQIPLFDPTHPPLTAFLEIPILTIYFDVCKCKTIYCTKIDMTMQAAQIRPITSQPIYGR